MQFANVRAPQKKLNQLVKLGNSGDGKREGPLAWALGLTLGVKAQYFRSREVHWGNNSELLCSHDAGTGGGEGS